MITIKIGGSVVDNLHPSTIDDIKKVVEQEGVILVHGGGKEVTKVTEQLSKLLSVLSDDVSYNVSKSGDKAIALEVNDQHSSVNFMLSDKSVINQPPALKTLPEFQVKIKVDRQFITRFVSGKSALSDTETFTVLSDGTDPKVVIGYASINTNRVTIPVVTTESSEIKNVSFNANLIKDVLVANKECESATLEVSEGGLAKINFSVDDYDVTYYLVAVQDGE